MCQKQTVLLNLKRNSNINLVKYSRNDRCKNEVPTSEVGAIRNRAKIHFYNLRPDVSKYWQNIVRWTQKVLQITSGTEQRRPRSDREALSQIFRLEIMTWRRNVLLILVGHSKCFCTLNQTNHTVPTVPFISVCKPPVKWWFADFV